MSDKRSARSSPSRRPVKAATLNRAASCSEAAASASASDLEPSPSPIADVPEALFFLALNATAPELYGEPVDQLGAAEDGPHDDQRLVDDQGADLPSATSRAR